MSKDDKQMLSEKARAVDSVRKQKMLQERQDRMLSDLQKRATTPTIQDPSLSTNDQMRVKGSNAPIDTKGIAKLSTGQEFMDKISKLRALKAMGKKALGILPLAGAGMAALNGDPAMAAEELAQDAAGPAGLAYEAIKPTAAGSAEDDAMIRAERQAQKNYMKSPAYMDAHGEQDMEDSDQAAIDSAEKLRKKPFSKLRSLFGD